MKCAKAQSSKGLAASHSSGLGRCNGRDAAFLTLWRGPNVEQGQRTEMQREATLRCKLAAVRV